MEMVQKSLIRVTYYYFLIDLYLLEYFSRKYTYLIFLFTFFFGTFGYSNGLTEGQFLVKFVCFLFSYYLISSSIVVFVLFNIPKSKSFLTNLLGKEFVVSKIGNPGISPLMKYGGAGLGVYFGNEVGKTMDRINITQGSNDFLQAQIKAIQEAHYLTPKEKQAAHAQALKVHAEMASRRPEGTLDRMAKIEAYKSVSEKAVSTFKSWFGKG